MTKGDGSGEGRGARRGARRPTLADVARRAGVSVTAVSYVVNRRGGISAATAEAVGRAAEELGFRPNRVARSLRQGASRVLGLVLPTVVNPFYPEVADAIVGAASRYGYHVFLSETGDDPAVQAREVEALCDHQVDGLLFTAVTGADRSLLEGLLRARVPFVQIVRAIEGLAADSVTTDNERGAREITEHLLRLGHRLVAVIAGPPHSSASAARLRGTRRALQLAGIRLPPSRLRFAELTREAGYRAGLELLAAANRPTALVCGNDMIAIGAADAILAKGLSVPGDVAVVGFDDMSLASSRLIGLTTVHQPLADFGRQGVELLMSRIADPDLLPRSLVLPHRIVVRRTCGASQSGDG